MQEKERETMTAKQVASELNVSRATIQTMIKDGRLKPIDPPNPALRRQKLLFRRADVEKLLKKE